MLNLNLDLCTSLTLTQLLLKLGPACTAGIQSCVDHCDIDIIKAI